MYLFLYFEAYTTLVKEFVKVLEDGVIPFVESSREIQKKKDTKEFKEDSGSYMTNKEKWLPSSADERALFQKHNEVYSNDATPCCTAIF